MQPFSHDQLQFAERQCHIRDRLYTKHFWGSNFYQVLEPLLKSFKADWGVPKQIDIRAESLPETTATVGLMLYRLGLIDPSAMNCIQNYLWSTHYYLASLLKSKQLNEIDQQELDRMNRDEACWSMEGRNTWTTAICIWTLVASQYNGPFTSLYIPALNWLLLQQNGDGSWGFVRDSENPPSIFLTAIISFTLNLCLYKLSFLENEQRQKLQVSIDRSLEYLRRCRDSRTKLWSTQENQREMEPTASTMALWALHHCGQSNDWTMIEEGVSGIKRLFTSNGSWYSYGIATGKIPDSGLSMALQGYTPALPLALMQLGVKPSDPVIVNAIEFIRENKQESGWDFPVFSRTPGRYVKSLYYVGTGEALTFTTALAIQTVEVWHKRLLTAGLEILNREKRFSFFKRA